MVLMLRNGQVLYQRRPLSTSISLRRPWLSYRQRSLQNRSLSSVCERPTLVSQDNVDRAPWMSMRHPEFQKRRATEEDPETAIGDIRGVTRVSERFLLTYHCSVCGRAMCHEISKQAYHMGSVLLRCTLCKWRKYRRVSNVDSLRSAPHK
eukprot:Blabericola_migrator_1__9013@NODE_479_length_8179_cov_106_519354_g373_i0_p7_GENE_NODE_479_length_8179_cov_106_519354_g373_i0NODE_479_length_8179_cov_106_519354_g373_i0_p7_ORF_typecomplete_len150_score4_97zfDNL/PF05180_12/8_9e09DUF5543/PF17697_1/0_055FYVE/PF01363_21/0_12ProkRING_2/PF14445_6/0_097ProkRING_2/PF14445_6/8e02C6_DPF/PF10170_9/0_15_NODE_479_length_8179_cov_106_519354_g373_i019162365